MAQAQLVEIADGNQVRYWCDFLGCTEAQLREAVRAVGSSPPDICDFLRRSVSEAFTNAANHLATLSPLEA